MNFKLSLAAVLVTLFSIDFAHAGCADCIDSNVKGQVGKGEWGPGTTTYKYHNRCPYTVKFLVMYDENETFKDTLEAGKSSKNSCVKAHNCQEQKVIVTSNCERSGEGTGSRSSSGSGSQTGRGSGGQRGGNSGSQQGGGGGGGLPSEGPGSPGWSRSNSDNQRSQSEEDARSRADEQAFHACLQVKSGCMGQCNTQYTIPSAPWTRCQVNCGTQYKCIERRLQYIDRH
jgi:hypothetical protein